MSEFDEETMKTNLGSIPIEQIQSKLEPAQRETEETTRTHPHRVVAYWRNNEEGGIVVVKAFHTYDDLFSFYDTMKEAICFYDANKLTAAKAHDVLTGMGADWANAPVLIHDLALDLIFWMQARGHLNPDNFNGILWFWITSSGTPVCCDGLDPSELRPRQ